jgi:hypothetical protein
VTSISQSADGTAGAGFRIIRVTSGHQYFQGVLFFAWIPYGTGHNGAASYCRSFLDKSPSTRHILSDSL